MRYSSTTEKQLVRTCQKIGDIADCRNQFTAALAKRIEQTGKPVMQLTLQELIDLDQAERVESRVA